MNREVPACVDTNVLETQSGTVSSSELLDLRKDDWTERW